MSKKGLIILIVILVIIAVLVFALISFINRANQSGGNVEGVSNIFTVQGTKVEITREGRGDEQVKTDDFMVVNYINKLSDGTKIDSTYDENRRPLTFKIGAGQVLKGWDVGLIGMKIGEIRRLTIPPDLAFGQEGFPAAGIPKNATLVSEVELLAIQN